MSTPEDQGTYEERLALTEQPPNGEIAYEDPEPDMLPAPHFGPVYSPDERQLMRKIAVIMEEVPYVQRTGKVTSEKMGKWTYASDKDLRMATRSKFIDKKIIHVPNCVSVNTIEVKLGTLFHVIIDWNFIDTVTGASLHVRMPGAGFDALGDKGLYKAITGSFKYAISQLLGIITGDDAEIDDIGDQESRKAKAKKDYAKNIDPKGAKLVEPDHVNPDPTPEDMDPWDCHRQSDEDPADLELDWWKTVPLTACAILERANPGKTVAHITVRQLLFALTDFVSLVDDNREGYIGKACVRLAKAFKDRLREELKAGTIIGTRKQLADGTYRMQYSPAVSVSIEKKK